MIINDFWAKTQVGKGIINLYFVTCLPCRMRWLVELFSQVVRLAVDSYTQDIDQNAFHRAKIFVKMFLKILIKTLSISMIWSQNVCQDISQDIDQGAIHRAKIFFLSIEPRYLSKYSPKFFQDSFQFHTINKCNQKYSHISCPIFWFFYLRY